MLLTTLVLFAGVILSAAIVFLEDKPTWELIVLAAAETVFGIGAFVAYKAAIVGFNEFPHSDGSEIVFLFLAIADGMCGILMLPIFLKVVWRQMRRRSFCIVMA